MTKLSIEQADVVARLQSGRLMVCEGQGDPNSDGCGGQGYTGASGQEPCRHCFGVGVMTPDLKHALRPVIARNRSREEIAQIIIDLSDEILEYEVGLGICGAGTVAYEAATAILALFTEATGGTVTHTQPDPDLGAQGEPVAWATGRTFSTERDREEISRRIVGYEDETLARVVTDADLLHACLTITPSKIILPALVDEVRKAIAALAPAAPRTGSGVSVEEIARAVFIANNRVHGGTDETAAQDWIDGVYPEDRQAAFDAAHALLALFAQAPRDGGETQGGSSEGGMR